MYKAGIDIGTNSLRLLIAKVNKEGRILEAPIRMVRTARLGEGIIAGQLLPAAVERALQILADFAREIAAFSPIEVNVVSTSVLRSVSNPELLLDPVRDQLGWQIQVLPGVVEARLSFLGAVNGTGYKPDNCLVVDIGGGSTELVSYQDGVLKLSSLDMGAVRMTEAYGEDYRAMEGKVKKILQGEIDKGITADLLLGVGGTVSALAQLELQLQEYSFSSLHMARLTREQVRKWLLLFHSMKPGERKMIKGLNPRRGEIILAGTLILQQVMEYFAYQELIVSETYLLEGLLSSSH